MSTQINVTVDSGGLRARAKQQQNAARQAQLERERTQRVEAEGRTQRVAKLTAEGNAPDGRPSVDTGTPAPEIYGYPAANRRLPTDQLVVYYLEDPPPQTTKQGVIVEDLYPSFSGGGTASYNTVIFQGVRALTGSVSNTDFTFPTWQIRSPKEIFDFGSKPFTVELWWRAFDNIVSANDAYSFVQLSIGPRLTLILEYEGRQNKDPLISFRDFEADGVRRTILDVSYQDASTFNHLAVQRQGPLDFTVHYKGNLIYSWDRSLDVSFTESNINIAVDNFFATGAAISQVRMTKGKAVYGTSSFTPPTTPFFRPRVS